MSQNCLLTSTVDLRSERRVGNTTLTVSSLGLGVAPLGNLYTEVSDADAEATLKCAERHHIRFFDVAPLYGFGLAEERLGRYLRQQPAQHRVISTKVGRILEPVAAVPRDAQFASPLSNKPRFDYTRAGIERSYDDSLRRLGIERVDILLLHDIDRDTHGVEHRDVMKRIFDEALPTLAKLKKDGRVTAIGLGVNQWDVGYEVLVSAEVDCILLAGRFTLLDQSALTSGFLDACARRCVSVIAGGVLNSGFLAGGPNYNYKPADGAILHRRSQLNTICRELGVSLPTAALQFAAIHPAITSTIVGARSVTEVDALMASTRALIPDEFWDKLRADGLIAADFPAPNLSQFGVRYKY